MSNRPFFSCMWPGNALLPVVVSVCLVFGRVQAEAAAPGFRAPGLNQQGLNQQGLNQPGLNEQGLDGQGSNEQDLSARALPCGWAVVAASPEDTRHPERPRHIAPLPGSCSTAPLATGVGPDAHNPDAHNLDALHTDALHPDIHGPAADRDRIPVRARGDGEGEGVRMSQVVSMTSEAAVSRIQLRVTALESGQPGQVIRCRSSLDGLVFRGRILDAHTVAMLGREGGSRW